MAGTMAMTTDANPAQLRSVEVAPFVWSRADAERVYQAPEAFLCVLALAATADGVMRPLESFLLQDTTRRWWERGIVREKDVEALNFAVCRRLEAGLDEALTAACEALPLVCHMSVYAQVLDLLLCDGPMRPREAELADALERALGLDAATTRRFREMMMVKNAY